VKFDKSMVLSHDVLNIKTWLRRQSVTVMFENYLEERGLEPTASERHLSSLIKESLEETCVTENEWTSIWRGHTTAVPLIRSKGQRRYFLNQTLELFEELYIGSVLDMFQMCGISLTEIQFWRNQAKARYLLREEFAILLLREIRLNKTGVASNFSRRWYYEFYSNKSP